MVYGRWRMGFMCKFMTESCQEDLEIFNTGKWKNKS
jgi:hypothetical protein